MIRKRPTDPFKAVYSKDEALLHLDDDMVKEYLRRRDFTIIEDALKARGLKPTIFHLYPIHPDHEHLIPSLEENSVVFGWEIFRRHCTKIEHFLDERGNDLSNHMWKPGSGKPELKEDAKGALDTLVYCEMAGLIVNASRINHEGFTLPAQFSVERHRLRRHLVASQPSETTETKPS